MKFLKKFGMLTLVIVLAISMSSYSKEYTVSSGVELIKLLEKLTSEAEGVKPLEAVVIKLSGTITLDTRAALYSFYRDPVSGNCRSHDFVIKSADPDNPAVIDGNSSSRGLLVILTCGNSNIAIENLTFQNSFGTSSVYQGAIILTAEKGDITIYNTKFFQNTEGPTGIEGGVRIESTEGKVKIRKSIFFNNSGTHNGALTINAPDILLENNLFSGNSSFSLNSGAVNIIIGTFKKPSGKAIISNNTIYGNLAYADNNKQKVSLGSGLNIRFYDTSSRVYVYNNIIYNNGINRDSYLYTYKGLQLYIDNRDLDPNDGNSNLVYLYNNDIGSDKFPSAGALTIDFNSGKSQQLWIEDTSTIPGTAIRAYTHQNNISDKPKLLNPSSSSFSKDISNYKLTSNSPVIDKGYYDAGSKLPFAKDDIDGENRPIDGDKDGTLKYDIGFDEYNPGSSSGGSGGSGGGGTTYTTITLNISPKPTNGTVKTKNSTDINCGTQGNACSKQYNTGTTITLEAVADHGYKFDGWNGGCAVLCSGTDNPCDITLPNDTDTLTCEAVFVATNSNNQLVLQIDVTGNGKVNITGSGLNETCKNSCQYNVNQGDNITLEAIADAGNKFKEWAGDCSGCKKSKCQISINGNTGCEAVFEIDNSGNNNNGNNNSGGNNGGDSGNNSGNTQPQLPADKNTDNTTGGGGCSFGTVYSIQLILLPFMLIAFRKFKNGGGRE